MFKNETITSSRIKQIEKMAKFKKKKGSLVRFFVYKILIFQSVNPLGTVDLKYYQSQGLSTFGDSYFFN